MESWGVGGRRLGKDCLCVKLALVAGPRGSNLCIMRLYNTVYCVVGIFFVVEIV